jgi:uncharacterized protein YegJ (DUF2314 family)
MFKSVLLALSTLVCTSAFVAQPAMAQQDKVINVPDDDPEMAAAIAKARSTLPEFWKAREAEAEGEENFSLKVMVPYGSGKHEHMWLVDIDREDDKLSGTISNQPAYATNVSQGDVHEFTEAEISDWTFMRNGKMVGNETMRPLLKRMSPEEAAPYRAMYEKP